MTEKLIPSHLLVFALLASVPGLFSITELTAKPKPAKTTAFSEVSPDYQRVRLPSGKFAPETYVFGEGKLLDNSNGDDSLHKLTFSGVAHTIAPALAEVDYLPATSKKDADLLIVVSWGKTKAFDRGMIDMSISNVSEAFQTWISSTT